jgi:hypothetical protein
VRQRRTCGPYATRCEDNDFSRVGDEEKRNTPRDVIARITMKMGIHPDFVSGLILQAKNSWIGVETRTCKFRILEKFDTKVGQGKH